eukprot:1712701-Pleurochrysis_carterae.AAC.1
MKRKCNGQRFPPFNPETSQVGLGAWCHQLGLGASRPSNADIFNSKLLTWSHLMHVGKSDMEVLVQPKLNIRPTGRSTHELQRREETAFERAACAGKSMHDAAEEAMDRPQKNKGGANTKRRCAFCLHLGHDASKCDFMSKASARARADSRAAQEAHDNLPEDASADAAVRKKKRKTMPRIKKQGDQTSK